MRGLPLAGISVRGSVQAVPPAPDDDVLRTAPDRYLIRPPHVFDGRSRRSASIQTT